MSATLHRLLVSLTVVAALAVAPVAAADGWLPHPADATWTYEWTDTVYNTTPTKEKVTVKEQKGDQFTLSWTTLEQGNDPAAPVSLGLIAFQETASGLVNTDWQSNPPPATFPILCAAPTQCNNSLSSADLRQARVGTDSCRRRLRGFSLASCGARVAPRPRSTPG